LFELTGDGTVNGPVPAVVWSHGQLVDQHPVLVWNISDGEQADHVQLLGHRQRDLQRLHLVFRRDRRGHDDLPADGYDGCAGPPGDHSAAAAADWLASARDPVEFDTKSPCCWLAAAHGQAAIYPVVQTVQRAGICREVIVPAPISAEHQMEALKVALAVAEELDVVGLLAVEMFHTEHGVLVNELAMRPHNSGHWTIDGAVTSQFEQHLRAVLTGRWATLRCCARAQ